MARQDMKKRAAKELLQVLMLHSFVPTALHLS